jgi:hypothetical protein
MASLSANKARQSLLRKGFKKFEGDHHHYTYTYKGKIVARTKLSHNDQDLNDHLISKMRKQCGLSKNQFFDLINCPLDEEGYIAALKEVGYITS